ncbi:MAG TPA: hypothetical protein VIV34_01775 [Pseudolabrys sp.]
MSPAENNIEEVVLVKEATSASDTGVTGFNARYVPLLATVALAGFFAIIYFILK